MADKVLLKEGVPIATTAPTGEVKMPHEAEMERKRELLARVRNIKASLISSMATVNGGQASRHYSWVNRHESRVTVFASMGYSICRDPAVKTAWVQPDGSHIRGDMILMEIDKDLYEAWQFEAERSAVESVETAQEGFKEFAGRSGVPVYNPPIKG